MMRQVEKVARAMEAAAEIWALGTDNDACDCPYGVMALAALRALREPSEGMLKAVGFDGTHCPTCSYDGLWEPGERGLLDGRRLWESMIDAAIHEAETA